MIVLGIETTAHTFGASIIDTEREDYDRILSNVREMATTKKGGMIPSRVADHHEEIFKDVIDRAFSEAKKSWDDVELIAASRAPGMGHALRVGVAVARTLAMIHDKPLVGVNHCIAHLEVASMVTDSKDPLLLYCSGANTQIIAYEAGKYRIFGETLDTGIGNFLDTLARKMGLGFPGGPKIENLAKECKSKDELLEMPYSVKGMDLAFSGILTNLEKKIKDGVPNEDIAYSTQEVVFAMLVEVAERAMAHCGKNELVLGGGVACNKRLQEMCQLMCESRGAKLYVPQNQLLVDNAAMIAWTGYLMHKFGDNHEPELFSMDPYERTDEVAVTWR